MKGVVAIAVAILVLGVISTSFRTVAQTARGVRLTFGAASATPLQPGLHFKLPVAQRIEIMPVAVHKSETESDAASSDLQKVSTTVALNYHVVPERAVEVYSRIGAFSRIVPTVIDPAVRETTKAVDARYTAEQLITQRAEVARAIKEALTDRLLRYGIVIDDFSITDFSFSATFDAAIEAKTVAEQQVLTEKRNLQRIEIEAQQRVATAKGKADAIRLQAEAEADALRMQREQISRELVQLRAVEAQRAAIDKWDGKLPTVTGDGVPLIDVSAVVRDAR